MGSASEAPPSEPKALRVSVYGGSQGLGDVEQMVTTVCEVLLARLDDLGETALWPIAEDCGLTHETFLAMYQRMLYCLFPIECGEEEVDEDGNLRPKAYVPDPAERVRDHPTIVWQDVRVVEEYEVTELRDGVEVTEKRERVVVKKLGEWVMAPVMIRSGGLFPFPCAGVGDARAVAFAKHLLAGQASPIARHTIRDPNAKEGAERPTDCSPTPTWPASVSGRR